MILLLEKRCVSWEPGSVKAVTALVYGWIQIRILWERSRRAYYGRRRGDRRGSRSFSDMEYQYDAITELIVTKDMTERKTKMIELGDVFIAFPGGTGTLEEIAEVMSKVSLKHLEAPCILYNLNGYYDSLKALLSHMTEMGLSSPERQEGIYFARDLSETARS